MLIQAELFTKDNTKIFKLSSTLYVSVKSKLQHPPRAYPRAFDVFSCPGGGDLLNLIFPGTGIWSLLIGGVEFDR